MAKVIEVYVKNTQVPVGAEQVYYCKSPGHECTKTPITLAVMERVFSEADLNALRLSVAIAKEKGLKVRVYNISTFKGKLKAQLKGVHKTPTIIVENHRFEDTIAKDQLLSVL